MNCAQMPKRTFQWRENTDEKWPMSRKRRDVIKVEDSDEEEESRLCTGAVKCECGISETDEEDMPKLEDPNATPPDQDPDATPLEPDTPPHSEDDDDVKDEDEDITLQLAQPPLVYSEAEDDRDDDAHPLREIGGGVDIDGPPRTRHFPDSMPAIRQLIRTSVALYRTDVLDAVRTIQAFDSEYDIWYNPCPAMRTQAFLDFTMRLDADATATTANAERFEQMAFGDAFAIVAAAAADPVESDNEDDEEIPGTP